LGLFVKAIMPFSPTIRSAFGSLYYVKSIDSLTVKSSNEEQ